jgi:hypothetical protein
MLSAYFQPPAYVLNLTCHILSDNMSQKYHTMKEFEGRNSKKEFKEGSGSFLCRGTDGSSEGRRSAFGGGGTITSFIGR